MTRRRAVATALWLAAAASGCGEELPIPQGEPGTPLPGLTGEETARFFAGAALFNKVFRPEEGLGPAYNENQCSACHTVPAPGGTTLFEFVRRATHYEGGVCDLLSDQGGDNIRNNATPALRAAGVERETAPPGGTVGRFTTPFLFGLGLVEAIPEETILAAADPDDADGNGISGRPGRTIDGRFGRFGRKGDNASIREFVAGAAGFEMGLTTPLRPEETGVDGQPPPPGTDPTPDPEIDQAGLDALTAFVRFLAPPAPTPERSPAHRDTLWAGERLFEQIGCAECHTPSLETGPNAVAALDRKTVQLYSDLLLHDLGDSLADVCGPAASPSEIRTEMLMGLQHRETFMHDGRAFDLEEAILAHGGEAAASRTAYRQLTWLRQRYLLAFLASR